MCLHSQLCCLDSMCGKTARVVSSPVQAGCTAGMLLKEMIEDLEWTAIGSNNSTVEVCLQRQPRRLLFTAQAAGSLQVSQGWFHCSSTHHDSTAV